MKKWTVLVLLLCFLFLFSGCSLLDMLKPGTENPEPDPAAAAQAGKDEGEKEPEAPKQDPAPSQDTPKENKKPNIISTRPRKGDEPSGNSDPEAPLPIEISMTQDFSEIAGDWYEEEGYSVLNIYENGGFLLSDETGDYYGFLVYSEEESFWVSEPHYDMYEENNEQLFGSACLIPDPDDPNMLAYVVGGGAVRYIRGEQDPEWYEPSWVYVDWPNDQATFMYTDEVVVNSDEPQVTLLLYTYGQVQDFCFLSLEATDVDEDGYITFSCEVVYEREVLEPGLALYVTTCMYGDIPNNGFKFIDDAGEERWFAIDISGEDGSPYLWELE